MTGAKRRSPKKNRPREKHWLVLLSEYSVAFLSVAVALGLNLLFKPQLASTPTPLFFAAVMVSAWCGGLEVGLLATILSTLAINYFLVEPIYTFNIPNVGALARLGVFVMASILISSLNGAQRAAKQKAEANYLSLRESEARFGCLAESNIIGMIVADLDGAILESNDIFLEMVGYSREELRSGRMHWWEMTSPESLEASKNAVQELRTTGVCTPFEKEYIRKDGSRISVLHGAVLSGENTVTGFVLDLSERKRVEVLQQEALQRERSLHAEVQAANEKLEIVLASINDQFLVLDHEWRYVYLSDQVVKTVGKTREELLGQCIWDVFPETVDSLFYTELHRAVAEQKIIQFEFFFAPWQCWFENRVYPAALGVSILVTDITDRKQTEEALRHSEERYRAIYDQVLIGISQADLTGKFLSANERFCEIVGRSTEELLTLRMQDITHPDDLPHNQVLFQQMLQDKSSFEIEKRYLRPDGSVVWVRNYVSLVHNAAGEPKFGVAVTEDITERIRNDAERKQAEQERERLLAREKAAREQAETANRIKDEFLAVLSHELRSPLNPILGWSKLLQKGTLSEQAVHRALETIERNAKLQTQLIDDLLDVSRILRGKMGLNTSPVNLVTVVESALETVQLAAATKQIHITKKILLDNNRVFGDSTRLQQIIWNLLSNAVKFTPVGGQIEVRLEQVWRGAARERNEDDQGRENRGDGGVTSSYSYAQITVRDTGKGINPNFLPYVFDYFRQEDGKTTRKFGGLGLGLAIVRHLTELHGGTVHAESAGEGQGATFIVQLPLLPVVPDSDKTSAIPAQSLDLSRVRILVVDDDGDMRALTQAILEQQGAQVTVAASAAEVLTLLNHQPPDILISDIGMPDVDGYMLMQEIRGRSPEQGGQVLAIALTAYAGEYDQQQALKVGFQKHLAKPIEPEALVSTIAALVTENGSPSRLSYDRS